MKNLKGIGLLLLANILIFVTLSITFTVLSEFVLPAFGIDIRGSIGQQDLLWAFVFGFGGAFISLAFSKQMAKSMMNCQQITQPRTQAEMLVFDTVRKISTRLDVKMPEVYVYEGEDPNAFATGPSKNNSMVAVSTGLLNNLNENEVRAVLAHEMGHVYNGDMFTTTILAGLMNTFVYFISRWVYRQVAERNPMLGFGVYIFLQIVLSFLAMIPISWWSRRREFVADRFAANTVGKEHMISALQSIDRWVKGVQYQYSTEDALATMKISGQTRSMMQMFATHPPIEARVAALQRL
ncbi:MAG: protease HtpX [Nitrospirales bacterium]|nr:MAG: protease HtpX [Nitrospirales bacterium]